MDLYIILALIAMVLFGVNAIIYKLAPGIDAITLTLISFSFSAIGTFIIWLFYSEKQISFAGIGYGALGGVLSVAALVAFIAALQKGNASVVNTIRALSAGVTVIIAVILLSEKITLVKSVGIGFALIAAVLLTL